MFIFHSFVFVFFIQFNYSFSFHCISLFHSNLLLFFILFHNYFHFISSFHNSFSFYSNTLFHYFVIVFLILPILLLFSVQECKTVYDKVCRNETRDVCQTKKKKMCHTVKETVKRYKTFSRCVWPEKPEDQLCWSEFFCVTIMMSRRRNVKDPTKWLKFCCIQTLINFKFGIIKFINCYRTKTLFIGILAYASQSLQLYHIHLDK